MARRAAWMMCLLAACAPAAADPLDGAHGWIRTRLNNDRVDSAGFARNADARTLSTRAGIELLPLPDMALTLEVEDISHLGPDDFNDLTNGRVAYPVVVAAESMGINRLNASWWGLPHTQITLGRQALAFDDQRFVGPNDWFQNDNAFDALSIRTTPLDGLTLDWAGVWRQAGVLGRHHPRGTTDSESHLLHARWQARDDLAAIAYGYFIDQRNNPAASSRTLGGRLEYETRLSDDWSVTADGEYAHQSDYAGQPARFGLDIRTGHLGARWRNWRVAAGYESLEGDSANAVQTPFGSTYDFHGHAYRFARIPADGLEDASLRLDWQLVDGPAWAQGLKVWTVFHDFDAERDGRGYGHEWDMGVRHRLTEQVEALAHLARYRAHGFATDTDWLLLQLSVAFDDIRLSD